MVSAAAKEMTGGNSQCKCQWNWEWDGHSDSQHSTQCHSQSSNQYVAVFRATSSASQIVKVLQFVHECSCGSGSESVANRPQLALTICNCGTHSCPGVKPIWHSKLALLGSKPPWLVGSRLPCLLGSRSPWLLGCGICASESQDARTSRDGSCRLG